MSKHSHIPAIFDYALQSQASSPDANIRSMIWFVALVPSKMFIFYPMYSRTSSLWRVIKTVIEDSMI